MASEHEVRGEPQTSWIDAQSTAVHDGTQRTPNMKKTYVISSIIAVALVVAICSQITLFVVPPIGAVPEGRTVVISRLNKTEFIDSPDAMCERIQGYVSLLCRGMVLGTVLEKSTILLRLPYSEWLYSISTGGKTYDR